jgi:hypothetical protein
MVWMRRYLAVSMVAVATGGALLSAAIAAASQAPRAQLRSFVCQRALDPGQREVSVTAVMRPVQGTQKLQVRFVLLSKAPGASSYTVVQGGNLGTWLSPTNPSLGTRPGDVWDVNHPVVDLPAPDTYRFQVTFRWLGNHGRVLGSTVRNGPKCHQPELRPDLAVISFVSQPVPAHPKRNLYVATITDNGLTGAGPFSVEFTDGSLIKNQTVRHIRPHQQLTVDFGGPVCDPMSPPTVTVDPTQQVDDYNRSNNSLVATCG